MRIYAILLLAMLATASFAAYSQAMASLVAFDNQRVSYANSLSEFYAIQNGVKNPQVNASMNRYYFYNIDSKYRFSTEKISGNTRYDDSVADQDTKIVPQGEWQNAISGSRLYATNSIAAGPDMASARGEMLYASRDYVAAAAQAMLDSITFAREGLAQMPDTTEKMQLDYDLAKYQQTFSSRIPLVKACIDPASMIYYAALTGNDIDSAKPAVRKALAAYARFEASNLKSVMEETRLGTPGNIPDFSDSFSGFNDYDTLNAVKAAVDGSGY
ncbi:MAG: hypothetical protein WC506_02760 [Candidatus Micrarchaeia archaeon]